MEIRDDLELVDVTYEDKKAILTFLDSERGEIRQVNFNKQSYDKEGKRFVEDEEKAQKVEEWSQEFFNVNFDRLNEAIGDIKTVYCYDTFNSLFPCKTINKFDEDMLGQILEVEVIDIVDDGHRISIQFDFDGDTYESKMQYAEYLPSKKDWFVNPVKRKKQYEKFEEKFQIPVERMEELVGKMVMIEVKKAMGKYIYPEVKPFPKRKLG